MRRERCNAAPGPAPAASDQPRGVRAFLLDPARPGAQDRRAGAALGGTPDAPRSLLILLARWSCIMAERTWRKRTGRFVRLQVEQLEGRLTPAGNVTALLLRGNLLVVGDSAANAVEITAAGGDLVVRGQPGTTVNGGAAATFSGVGSVAGNLVVLLGRGADTANIHDLSVGGYAAIDGGVLASLYATGPGDQITLDTVKVGTYLVVTTGGTDDTVVLNAVQVGEDTAVLTYGGSDKVTISGSQFGGALAVATGA